MSRRIVAFALAAMVAATIVLFPGTAPAAAGTMNTSAIGARVYIGLLNGALPIDLQLPTRRTWTTGGNPNPDATTAVDLLPPLLPNLIYVGAITANAAPVTNGGMAEAKVAGLKLINNTLAVDGLADIVLEVPLDRQATISAVPAVVVCALDLPAKIDLPVVIPKGADPGRKLVGGCIDAALDKTAPDGRCDDDADVPIPPLVVGRHAVNLAVRGTTPAALTSGKPLLVRIPYTNEGTQTAKDVRFTVTPPPGVTVSAATTLLNARTTAAGTVNVACTTKAATVTCEAPDAPSLRHSELWLTLTATSDAKTGERSMAVAVSTTSTDGNDSDNITTVRLELAAKDGGTLTVTGPRVAGLAALAVILVALGAALLIGVPARKVSRRPGG